MQIKRVLLITGFFFFILSFSSAKAQVDTTKQVVYDYVYLKEGGTLKGEIISFDPITGGLVFKDLLGRKYSFSREEYHYIIEDKVEIKKERKSAIVLSRKENEFEVNVGISTSITNINSNLEIDDYYIEGSDVSYIFGVVSLKIGAGKYFNRKHFIGLTSEIGLLSSSKKDLNVGLRYAFQYDAMKKNKAFYLPVELKYGRALHDLNFTVNDTVFFENGYSFPKDIHLKSQFSTFEINVGHGFGFMMANKRSISLELLLVRYFGVKASYKNTNGLSPNASYSLGGIKMAVIYNL